MVEEQKVCKPIPNPSQREGNLIENNDYISVAELNILIIKYSKFYPVWSSFPLGRLGWA